MPIHADQTEHVAGQFPLRVIAFGNETHVNLLQWAVDIVRFLRCLGIQDALAVVLFQILGQQGKPVARGVTNGAGDLPPLHVDERRQFIGHHVELAGFKLRRVDAQLGEEAVEGQQFAVAVHDGAARHVLFGRHMAPYGLSGREHLIVEEACQQQRPQQQKYRNNKAKTPGLAHLVFSRGSILFRSFVSRRLDCRLHSLV